MPCSIGSLAPSETTGLHHQILECSLRHASNQENLRRASLAFSITAVANVQPACDGRVLKGVSVMPPFCPLSEQSSSSQKSPMSGKHKGFDTLTHVHMSTTQHARKTHAAQGHDGTTKTHKRARAQHARAWGWPDPQSEGPCRGGLRPS